MPELPDITIYLEALEKRVLGHTLDKVRLANPFLLRTVEPAPRDLEGKRVGALHRVGKRIVLAFEDELFLVIHLMIAGRLKWLPKGAKVPGKAGLAAFDFDSGTLMLTEAGSKRRASLHILRGEGALRALDPGGKWGGTAHINRHRKPVTITVYPLMRVDGRVSFEKMPPSLRKWNERAEGFRGSSVVVRRKRLMVDGNPSAAEYVASGPLRDGRFEFYLPAGEYELLTSARIEPVPFSVASGRESDLGVLEALPTARQALYDAPAPALKLADARGIPTDFHWSSVRGRWVILYFWDHRNRANPWLQGLIDAWTSWSEHRDQFEFIAVHNSDSVLTVNDLERILQWETENPRIPFPVAIDDGEKTFNAYAIERGLPRRANCLFVINPDGRVEFTQGGPPVEYVRRKLEPRNP